jgi:hypothetical protein
MTNFVTVYHCLFPESLGILNLEAPMEDNMQDDMEPNEVMAPARQQINNLAQSQTTPTADNYQNATTATIVHITLKLPLQIIQTITTIITEILVLSFDRYKKGNKKCY